MDMTKLRFFEVDFINYDENNVPEVMETICIKGVREPSDIELKEYMANDLKESHYDSVELAGEISYEEMCVDYGDDNDPDYLLNHCPTFGI